MRTLQVATAFGKNFVNPDPKVIKRLILETAEKDWMTGSGDSVFSSRQDKIESRLILGGSNMSGLTLMFQDSLPPTATWHLTEGNHTGETFETTVGGNIIPLLQGILGFKRDDLESRRILFEIRGNAERAILD